jgi:hypothetical protein
LTTEKLKLSLRAAMIMQRNGAKAWDNVEIATWVWVLAFIIVFLRLTRIRAVNMGFVPARLGKAGNLPEQYCTPVTPI